MNYWAFVLSICLILITPGPTNTVMALGGYSRGWINAVPLVVAELSGYLAVVTPVATLAAPLFQTYPVLSLYSRMAACGWVLFLAYRLWKSGQTPNMAAIRVSARQIFVTTVLNPKAVIIGLVIMPHETLLSSWPLLALFSALVVVAANGWICLGAIMRQAGAFEVHPELVQRIAAGFLLLFAIILGSSVIYS